MPSLSPPGKLLFKPLELKYPKEYVFVFSWELVGCPAKSMGSGTSRHRVQVHPQRQATSPAGTTSASENCRHRSHLPAVSLPEERREVKHSLLPSPPEGEPTRSPVLPSEPREKAKQTPKSTRCLLISFDLILLQSVSVPFLPPTTSHPATKYREYTRTGSNGNLECPSLRESSCLFVHVLPYFRPRLVDYKSRWGGGILCALVYTVLSQPSFHPPTTL